MENIRYMVELPITYLVPKVDDAFKGMSEDLINDLGLNNESEELEDGTVFIDLNEVSIFNEGTKPNTTVLRIRNNDEIWVINVSLEKFMKLYIKYSNVTVIKSKKNGKN